MSVRTRQRSEKEERRRECHKFVDVVCLKFSNKLGPDKKSERTMSRCAQFLAKDKQIVCNMLLSST